MSVIFVSPIEDICIQLVWPVARLVAFEEIMAASALDASDAQGTTQLTQAAIDGDTSKARQLLEHGAGVDVQLKDGWTALFEAAIKGHDAVVELLV